jgi:hypothetical protein
MKTLKIVYWVSTCFFACLFLTTGTLYLLHTPFFVKRTLDLHYPPYLLDIIGTAKILGAISLVTPKYIRLKEWAYAGFYFDFIGAMWSHFVIQGKEQYFLLLAPVTILTLSYMTYQRLQRNPSTAIIKN